MLGGDLLLSIFALWGLYFYLRRFLHISPPKSACFAAAVRTEENQTPELTPEGEK
jgi:hypothetical protein